MSDDGNNITPLRPGARGDVQKQQWLDHMAESYDQMVAAEELGSPTCMLFAMTDERGNVTVHWISEGNVPDHMVALYVSRMTLCIEGEVHLENMEKIK